MIQCAFCDDTSVSSPTARFSKQLAFLKLPGRSSPLDFSAVLTSNGMKDPRPAVSRAFAILRCLGQSKSPSLNGFHVQHSPRPGLWCPAVQNEPLRDSTPPKDALPSRSRIPSPPLIHWVHSYSHLLNNHCFITFYFIFFIHKCYCKNDKLQHQINFSFNGRGWSWQVRGEAKLHTFPHQIKPTPCMWKTPEPHRREKPRLALALTTLQDTPPRSLSPINPAKNAKSSLT